MQNRHARRAAKRAARREDGSRTNSGFIGLVRERPLLVVGAGIALGMVLGALLPWDSIDEEFLGDQAEKLKDGALDIASDGYEKVKSAAQSTYNAAAETLGVNNNGSGSGESSTGRSNQTYGTSRT
ncbi:MAG TPA: hypothetical protein VHW69_01075 [Rhizomicrobium sp.]|jgi:ElaB/YqjD/DUF883 family membrane-anchored ribosome-binding protein|nr:hypothetical protein [Rhizomicrobium sp.]